MELFLIIMLHLTDVLFATAGEVCFTAKSLIISNSDTWGLGANKLPTVKSENNTKAKTTMPCVAKNGLKESEKLLLVKRVSSLFVQFL